MRLKRRLGLQGNLRDGNLPGDLLGGAGRGDGGVWDCMGVRSYVYIYIYIYIYTYIHIFELTAFFDVILGY